VPGPKYYAADAPYRKYPSTADRAACISASLEASGAPALMNRPQNPRHRASRCVETRAANECGMQNRQFTFRAYSFLKSVRWRRCVTRSLDNSETPLSSWPAPRLSTLLKQRIPHAPVALSAVPLFPISTSALVALPRTEASILLILVHNIQSIQLAPAQPGRLQQLRIARSAATSSLLHEIRTGFPAFWPPAAHCFPRAIRPSPRTRAFHWGSWSRNYIISVAESTAARVSGSISALPQQPDFFNGLLARNLKKDRSRRQPARSKSSPASVRMQVGHKLHGIMWWVTWPA